MGKFVMSAVAAVLAVVFLAGCGKTPKHWYNIKDNHYVNLSKVTYFNAMGAVVVEDKDNKGKELYILGSDEGPVGITEENIEKALEKLEKYDVKKAKLAAVIMLDGRSFELPVTVEKKGKTEEKSDEKADEKGMKKYSKDEIKEILNDWLKIVNDVKASLP